MSFSKKGLKEVCRRVRQSDQARELSLITPNKSLVKPERSFGKSKDKQRRPKQFKQKNHTFRKA